MESKEEKKDKKSSILDKVKNNIPIFTLITGLLTAGYALLNFVYADMWKKDCENYYGIPGKYFTTSINETLILIGMLLLLIACAFVPIIMKQKRKEEYKEDLFYKVYSLSLTGLFSVLLGLLNVLNLGRIVDTFHNNVLMTWMNKFFVIVCIIVIFLFGVTLLCILFAKEIRSMRNKCIKNAINKLFAFSLAVTAVLYLSGIYFQTTKSIEDKRKYELITNLEEQYIVLSEFDNKVLIVTYEVDADGKYTIFTNEYSIVDAKGLWYSYVAMDTDPEIIQD